MAWIFQGNPNRFDIDDYLSRYSYIYWSAPTNQKDFEIGDRAFIWRSGAQAGLVAIGIIKEKPTPRKDVKIQEALGDDLWVSQSDEPTDIKVGIEIEDVRLTEEEGFVSREQVKANPILSKNRIISNPVGTVFRLKDEEVNVLLSLWGNIYSEITTPYSATEGSKQLRSHYRRERSSKLISAKKVQFQKEHGRLFCEICEFSFENTYPETLGKGFIEAHHKVPLSKIDTIVRTTLDDLLLVCSNCHRMIHRTNDCEDNLQKLLVHFKKTEN
jgi:hypothetical protein